MTLIGHKRVLTKFIHPSHKMTKWKDSIVTIISTSRFGIIRKCINCEAEQVITCSDHHTHDELRIKCFGI